MEEGYETASSGGCVFMFRLTSQRVKGEVSERARPLPSARVLVFFLSSSETISVPLLLADFAGTSSPCVFFPSAKRLFYTVMRSRPITRARVASSVEGLALYRSITLPYQSQRAPGGGIWTGSK